MTVDTSRIAPSDAEPGAPRDVPVLWHLKTSNFNEKVRWALDYKRVPHQRRAAVPGRHPAIARRLGAGETFPVLLLGDRVCGDSTEIIRELEERFPESPLYPKRASDRVRALELEDAFDEALGPSVRLLFFHHLMADPQVMLSTLVPDLSQTVLRAARITFPLLRYQLVRRFEINDAAVQLAYAKIAGAAKRCRLALGEGDYLVGAQFSVADLSLAALVAPAITPPEYPYAQPQRGHPALEPLRCALDEYGLRDWALSIYARHRGDSTEVR